MEQDCYNILCVNCIKLAASLLSFPLPARALSINCDMCGAYVGYGGINYHYELLWLHRNTPPASYLENVSTWTKIFPIFLLQHGRKTFKIIFKVSKPRILSYSNYRSFKLRWYWVSKTLKTLRGSSSKI